MSVYSKLAARLCDRPEGGSLVGVDLASRLDPLAAAQPDSLDWRRSVVDLLKTVGWDASYGARKALALEMGYSQDLIDTKGSAEMNLWLLRALMERLAREGVSVPPQGPA